MKQGNAAVLEAPTNLGEIKPFGPWLDQETATAVADSPVVVEVPEVCEFVGVTPGGGGFVVHGSQGTATVLTCGRMGRTKSLKQCSLARDNQCHNQRNAPYPRIKREHLKLFEASRTFTGSTHPVDLFFPARFDARRADFLFLGALFL